MRRSWVRLLAVGSLIAVIGMGASVQGAGKRPVSKVKTGAVCAKPAPKKAPTKAPKAAAKPSAKKNDPKAKAAASAPKTLPRLVDLGATKCIPCKMMVPVLDEISKEYKGKLKVEFVDVWKDEAAARKYNVQNIPVQIFFDAKGKEVYRHVGYFPKDGIVAKLAEMGVK
ncbi:MAG TPA: thioredoxin family protein [Chloroflexota bacterium]|nr:thioredoxin family protein [Chloroflexota bacterium]